MKAFKKSLYFKNLPHTLRFKNIFTLYVTLNKSKLLYLLKNNIRANDIGSYTYFYKKDI